MPFGNGQRWRQNGRRETQHKRLSPVEYAAVRACYLLFKAIHHLILTNLAISGDHKMYERKVNELDKFFKVSGQEKDEIFKKNKRQINEEWRKAHLNNQKEHFERMIASNAEELNKMNLSKGKLKPFLDQGAQWAKNSLGRKFTKNDFEKGSLKIYEQANEQANSGPNTAAHPPHTASIAAKSDRSAPILNTPKPQPKITPAEFLENRAKNQEVPRPNTHGDKNMNQSTPGTKRPAPTSPEVSPSIDRDGKKPHVDEKTPPPPSPVQAKSPVKNSDPSPNFDSPAPISPKKTNFPPAQHGPSTSKVLEENGSRFRALEDTEVELDSFPTLKESLKVKSPSKHTPTPSRKRKKGRQESPPTPSSEAGETTPKRIPQMGVVNSASPTLRTESGLPNGETQTDSAPQKTKFSTAEQVHAFRPLNGARGLAIKQAWKMPKLTQKTLIIGDENLQRIEKLDDAETQILSYPGLKFSNLKLILEARRAVVEGYKRDPHKNENPGTKPDNVVIMVGQHDSNMQASSFHSNLGVIKPMLINQFGNSKIHFCQVNSPASEPHIKACNETVAEFCKKSGDRWNFLECLSDEILETDPADPTHWTPACAQKVASLIFDHLN